MSNREQWTRMFLWISVIGGGIVMGAKLFDLIVVASSWGASPPESLKLMPYGPNYPINPGTFFQPLSATMLLCIIGALISGWKTPFVYRKWLLVPVISFVVIWIFTVTVFWPMIGQLWEAGTGKIVMTGPELTALVNRWFVWDWMRVIVGMVSFMSSIKAISMPYPREAEK
ncbi:MAG TPA: DUF1772 domain-containing protein [candidate division Zixibacteria bacterium]|nr:DUF1772 domain-containing protein [candidate division Zixibacteria bacterium]